MDNDLSRTITFVTSCEHCWQLLEWLYDPDNGILRANESSLSSLERDNILRLLGYTVLKAYPILEANTTFNWGVIGWVDRTMGRIPGVYYSERAEANIKRHNKGNPSCRRRSHRRARNIDIGSFTSMETTARWVKSLQEASKSASDARNIYRDGYTSNAVGPSTSMDTSGKCVTSPQATSENISGARNIANNVHIGNDIGPSNSTDNTSARWVRSLHTATENLSGAQNIANDVYNNTDFGPSGSMGTSARWVSSLRATSENVSGAQNIPNDAHIGYDNGPSSSMDTNTQNIPNDGYNGNDIGPSRSINIRSYNGLSAPTARTFWGKMKKWWSPVRRVNPPVAFAAPFPSAPPLFHGDDIDDQKGDEASSSSSSSCVICLDAPVEGACIPCGHMAGCMSCLTEIKGKKWGCPVCRAKIEQVVRIYVA